VVSVCVCVCVCVCGGVEGGKGEWAASASQSRDGAERIGFNIESKDGISSARQLY